MSVALTIQQVLQPLSITTLRQFCARSKGVITRQRAHQIWHRETGIGRKIGMLLSGELGIPIDSLMRVESKKWGFKTSSDLSEGFQYGLDTHVGKMVSSERHKRGWSQGELARRTGFPHGVLASLEGDDKASLKVLSACEREFNLERGTLLQYLLYQKAIHLCQCIEIPVRKYAKMILNVEGEVRAAKQSRRRGRPRRDPEFSLAVARHRNRYKSTADLSKEIDALRRELEAMRHQTQHRESNGPSIPPEFGEGLREGVRDRHVRVSRLAELEGKSPQR